MSQQQTTTTEILDSGLRWRVHPDGLVDFYGFHEEPAQSFTPTPGAEVVGIETDEGIVYYEV